MMAHVALAVTGFFFLYQICCSHLSRWEVWVSKVKPSSAAARGDELHGDDDHNGRRRRQRKRHAGRSARACSARPARWPDALRHCSHPSDRSLDTVTSAKAFSHFVLLRGVYSSRRWEYLLRGQRCPGPARRRGRFEAPPGCSDGKGREQTCRAWLQPCMGKGVFTSVTPRGRASAPASRRAISMPRGRDAPRACQPCALCLLRPVGGRASTAHHERAVNHGCVAKAAHPPRFVRGTTT